MKIVYMLSKDMYACDGWYTCAEGIDHDVLMLDEATVRNKDWAGCPVERVIFRKDDIIFDLTNSSKGFRHF